MHLKLEHLNYTELNSRQKERYNFQKIAGLLADYGYSSIKLDDDWQGADFIAQHFKTKEFLSIQLKGRLTFSKKYQNKNLFIAFPYNNDWYLFNHDEMLNKFLEEFSDSMATSKSWIEGELYSWNNLSKKILDLLQPYKLIPAKQIGYERTETENENQ